MPTVKQLKDIIRITSGGTPSKKKPEYWDGDIPWISAKSMKGDTISDSSIHITREGLIHGSKIAPKGSILLLVRGSGLFNDVPICYVDRDVAFNQDVKCLESLYPETIPNKYIFYWLKSQKYRLFRSVGVTTIGAGKFDTDFILNLEIPIPALDVMKRQIGFMDALSSKLICNEKINQNLLQQAKLLYKERVINMSASNGAIPNDWHEGTVSEIIELHDSQRIPLSSRERAALAKVYPYYGATSVMDYVDRYLFDGIYLLLGEDGTVVDDKGFPVLQYVEGKFWVNNHAHIITGKNGYSVELLYLMFSLTNVQSIVTGAVQPKISQANLNKVPVIIPSKTELESLDSLIQPIFAQIRNNIAENDRLATIRDTLLPRLMSGELDVSEIEL